MLSRPKGMAPARRLRWTLASLMLAAPALLPAKIDLVTLPAREQTQLTVYNSQDLTLVRETRTLSFSKGMNQIQFSWANTLIDPTSLSIDLKNAPGLVLQDAIYPANTRDLIVWNIEAEDDEPATVEIRYFCSGLSWNADYIVKADATETSLSLQQFTTIRNNSGEDFNNAVTRVVVGEVNLVELIERLAREGVQLEQKDFEVFFSREIVAQEAEMPRAMMMDAMAAAPAAARSKAREIIKKAVSEYHLFAVEGEVDITNGWGRELPNPIVREIPFDLSYEIDPNKFGNQAVKFYKFKNDTDHELGTDPLPDGTYYVYADDGREGLRFEGSTNHKYIPVGDDVELNLGSDGMVLYDTRTMASSRRNFDFSSGGDSVRGWDETSTIELEISNARDRAVPIKLTHYFDGDWTINSSSRDGYEKVDNRTVRWEFDLPAATTETITLEVLVRHGTNASTN